MLSALFGLFFFFNLIYFLFRHYTFNSQATLSAVEVGSSILEITPPLKTSEDLEIFDPLSVIPPRTVLPWDPVTKPMYSVNLTVSALILVFYLSINFDDFSCHVFSFNNKKKKILSKVHRFLVIVNILLNKFLVLLG